MADDSAADPDQLSRILMLAYGKMDSGGRYWCYVAVKPSRFAEFQRLMASKQYNMQNYVSDGYGEIIVSGEGALPPRNVTKQMAKMLDIPIRELFVDTNPLAVIKSKIEGFNAKQG